MWHHDIQTVGRAPLEDDHQPLISSASFNRGVSRAREKTRDRCRTHYRQRTVAKKYSASNRHKTSAFSRQLSARPQAES
jgi:hypothetical protein